MFSQSSSVGAGPSGSSSSAMTLGLPWMTSNSRAMPEDVPLISGRNWIREPPTFRLCWDDARSIQKIYDLPTSWAWLPGCFSTHSSSAAILVVRYLECFILPIVNILGVVPLGALLSDLATAGSTPRESCLSAMGASRRLKIVGNVQRVRFGGHSSWWVVTRKDGKTQSQRSPLET